MTKRPSLSVAKARNVVRGVEGIAGVYSRGYRWVHGTLEPAVRRLDTARARADRRLASYGYYLLGDVHDFNHAPHAAIREYQKCLALEPAEAAAWREIGTCYQEMGNCRLALRALRRSIALDPQDEYAKSEMELLEEHGARSLYTAGDRVWQAAEHLARGRFRPALGMLGRRCTTAARLQRARILGAMGDTDGVIREWRRLDGQLTAPWRATWKKHRTVRGAELEPGDWFFLPEAVWNDPEFWGLQWRLRGRLFGASHPPRCGNEDDFFAPFAAKLRFHLARTRENARAAKHLSCQYPEWKVARALATELGGV